MPPCAWPCTPASGSLSNSLDFEGQKEDPGRRLRPADSHERAGAAQEAVPCSSRRCGPRSTAGASATVRIDGSSSWPRRRAHAEARRSMPLRNSGRSRPRSRPGSSKCWMRGGRRAASKQVEPWDYRYAGGATDRGWAMRSRVRHAAAQRAVLLRPRCAAGAMDVIYDLDPREGKAPLAYADYVRRGDERDGKWVPTLVRVSGNYAHGGLGLLNELVHENGHVVHMMALHTRPAFMDLGDALFDEAFADVPSWSATSPPGSRSISAAARLSSLHCARCTPASCSTSRGRCSRRACCASRRAIRTRCGPRSRANTCT